VSESARQALHAPPRRRRQRLVVLACACALLVVAAIVVISIKGVGTRHARASASTLVSVPYSQLPYPAGRMSDGRYLTLVDTRMYRVTREPFRAKSTPFQQAVADEFASKTLSAIARYRDAKTAIADGYRPVAGDLYHYLKRSYLDDGRLADPSHVESLVYEPTPSGPVLAGAMYLAPGETHGPEVGGPATAWHYHAYQPAFCIVSSGFPVARPDAHGHCAVGAVAHRSPEMLHVWVWNPKGRFDSEMFIPTAAQIAAHFVRP
jgi:hypothetical protein